MKKPRSKPNAVRSQKPRLYLRHGEGILEGLKIIATLQLEAAIEGLRGKNVSPEPVHHARTYIKKTRAILQLAAPVLNSEDRDQMRRLLKEAAQKLSPLRDSEVQVMTLDLLLEEEGLNPEDYSGIRSGLADIAKQRRLNGIRQIPRVVSSLKKARKKIPDWHIGSLDSKDLRRRIRRTYRRGRTTLELCQFNHDPDLFHLWRKLLKQLWYSIRITEKFWPDEGVKLTGELELIGELAGKERDLTLLLETLKHWPKSKTTNHLVHVIRERLPVLRKNALDFGKSFYEMRPKDFVESLDL
jgi:CHAD domain-containing protein